MLSSSMAEKFIEDYPYTKNKITVIPSCADVNKIKPFQKKIIGLFENMVCKISL